MASLLPHAPTQVLSPFLNRIGFQTPLLLPNHRLSQRPLLRRSLCVARFGFHADPQAAEVVLRGLFGRPEGLLYTLADASVPSFDVVNAAAGTAQLDSDWFTGIGKYMGFVLTILKKGLYAAHVPYPCGFAIILLAVIVKIVEFPWIKEEVEFIREVKAIAPKLEDIEQRWGEDMDKILLETAPALDKINPLSGVLQFLVTVVVWIGLYKALSNTAYKGPLTEGFFWIPSLAGPNAVGQSGSGLSWLFPSVDGQQPLGWHDTLAYLVLPILLVLRQYFYSEIRNILEPPQSNDPVSMEEQVFNKLSALFTGCFALAVPSGLTLYWLTSDMLSTVLKLWLKKPGGPKNRLNLIGYDIGKKKSLDQIRNEAKSQIWKSVLEASATLKETRQEAKSASEGPGERFKKLKEQEARNKQQREEENRR